MAVVVDELSADLSQSHRLETLVEVLSDGELVDEVTTVTDGTVTLDSTAASRGRCDLTVVDDGSLGFIPTAADDLLAPYGHELRISRGAEGELVRLGVFRLDSISTPSTGQLRISGTDRSARIIDAKFEEAYQLASGTQATDAILDTIQLIWPDIETDFLAVDIELPALVASEGEDRWAFVQGIATAIGAELYFDGDGVLVLRPVPTAVSGNPVATYAEGEDTTLLDASTDWTRAGAVNRVIVTGESTDTTVAPPRGVATDDLATSPTYYYGSFGRSPYFWSSEYVTTADQAATAAAAILAQKLGTTKSVSLSAIVDPARRPSDVIRIECERIGVESEDHVIDAVQIPLAANGAMSFNTRATQVL